MRCLINVVALIGSCFAVTAELQCGDPFRLDVPLGLDLYLPTPPGNPLTREKIELGKKLFFDPILSRDRTISCSSCHEPEHAFTVSEQFAKGIRGQPSKRNPPALLNRVYGKDFFWDGRAGSLEDQPLRAIQNPKEMDLPIPELEQRLTRHNVYPDLFRTAFGREPRSQDTAKALASYVRSLLSGNSPYDRYLFGDRDALTKAATRGLKLFQGKANCTACHVGPNLTDEQFHNTGIAWHDGRLLDEGRFAITKREAGRGAFKTPTLRDVARTAPYMHDGSLATLAEVVQYYNHGGNENPNLDREIRPLRLDQEEMNDLLEFLCSLSGSIRFHDYGDPECRTTY